MINQLFEFSTDWKLHLIDQQLQKSDRNSKRQDSAKELVKAAGDVTAWRPAEVRTGGGLGWQQRSGWLKNVAEFAEESATLRD